MHDKRVQKGNTYAAMVIPAGAYPDTFGSTGKDATNKTQTMKSTFKQVNKVRKSSNIFQSDRNCHTDLFQNGKVREVFEYPNRDIPSPEPVYGRKHFECQTYYEPEELTDKPEQKEEGVATEFYLDRPPVPLFQPRMPAKENCKSTQIYDGDYELFDFDKEVEPMLNVLCEKVLEQARMEVLEENELAIIKLQSKEYQEIRNAELIEAQRFEAAEARVAAEISRRGVQQRARKSERKAAH